MSVKIGAKVLSGIDLSREIKQIVKAQITALAERFNGLKLFKVLLVIIQVGGRDDSNLYIKQKIRSAAEVGMEANHVLFPRNTTQTELLSTIHKYNIDPLVHGIIVQMPLDSVENIDSHLITNAVSPEKDVDGLNVINEGRVAIGDLTGLIPCTPNGVIQLIKRSGIEMAGAKSVVLGRSKLVGAPVASLLLWHNATVTICHSKTKDIKNEVSKADILVVAIGKPEFVHGSWIKPGAVVIDCGINYLPVSSRISGRRLVGDVHYESASAKASAITPVPGGVGPMTVAMLLSNTVQSATRVANEMHKKNNGI